MLRIVISKLAPAVLFSHKFVISRVPGQFCSLKRARTFTPVFTLQCVSSSRIIENGQERVEVEEDGRLTSLTVNGKEQPLRLDSK